MAEVSKFISLQSFVKDVPQMKTKTKTKPIFLFSSLQQMILKLGVNTKVGVVGTLGDNNHGLGACSEAVPSIHGCPIVFTTRMHFLSNKI